MAHDPVAGRAFDVDGPLGRLREPERLVVNIASIYSELSAEEEPLNPLAAFEQMAELARTP